MSTQEIPSQADFRERAKTNDVPIARLIGFEAKDIADGAGDGRLGGRTTACKSHGNAAWRNSLRYC
jgi:hypothetical protein